MLGKDIDYPNGFWGACAHDGYQAVVPVPSGGYHAFDTIEVGRSRCDQQGIPGFWRLKERKA